MFRLELLELPLEMCLFSFPSPNNLLCFSSPELAVLPLTVPVLTLQLPALAADSTDSMLSLELILFNEVSEALMTLLRGLEPCLRSGVAVIDGLMFNFR
ncbi:hypothetical protein WICPIJ_009490 [Wickerhamomyces pijperi]|uniref:Uncharacterized protein n=1 Tax=Wickerhamomyces pijperi TaxID=599730 RepID=A0A9P8PM24_WICPI|nr:hypothetical protein WICPIJ_009490 [Wickerhamomyces pijperi]